MASYARRSSLPVKAAYESRTDRVVSQTVVDKLNAGEAVTLQAGGDSVTLDPPAQPTFEVTAEREGPTNGQKESSIEFELEWPDGGEESGELEIG